jgi:hypothetical protein
LEYIEPIDIRELISEGNKVSLSDLKKYLFKFLAALNIGVPHYPQPEFDIIYDPDFEKTILEFGESIGLTILSEPQ